MATWDVRVKKDHPPKFPAMCVRCGAEPTTTISVKQDATGWWSYIRMGWLYGILAGRGYQLPACEPCAKQVGRDKRKRTVFEYAVWILAVVIAIKFFGDVDGMLGYLLFLGVAVLVAIPYALFEIFFPPAVDITVTDSSVTFHFASEKFAQAFVDDNPVY